LAEFLVLLLPLLSARVVQHLGKCLSRTYGLYLGLSKNRSAARQMFELYVKKPNGKPICLLQTGTENLLEQV
jgi:hypothetical protein